jgi:hypothetical protein
MSFTCSDKDALVAYVYGECDPATRAAIDAHVATCAACADEIGGFGSVRSALGAWTPPDRAVPFKIVREEPAEASGARVLRPARWWASPLPLAARAAAALLLFAAGAVLANNIEVRYDKDGFVVRSGWQKPTPPSGQPPQSAQAVPAAPVAAQPAAQPAASDAQLREQLVAVERQMRDLREEFNTRLAAVKTERATPAAGAVQPVSFVPTDEEQLDARIRAIVDQAIFLRRIDLQRVQPGLGLSDISRQRQVPNRNLLFDVSLKK